MKRNLVRLICAALALVLCLGASLPAFAAQPEYTMAGKLLKQLWAGSGFSGTLEVELAANPAASGDAWVTDRPFLINWDYIYVRPTDTADAQHRVNATLMNGETPVSQAHFRLQDGVVSLSSPLLGDNWWKLELNRLLQTAAESEQGTLAAQLTPGVEDALKVTGMPSVLRLLLPQLLYWQDHQDSLAAVLEQMMLRMDLWIEGYRQDAALERTEDGNALVTVSYRVSPASIKAQAKQMVLDILTHEEDRAALAAAMDGELAALLLNPAYQPYYFAAIDQLPLTGDLTLRRTVDMQGQTAALHLSMPFYDPQGGNVTLKYDRERGVGDLPDNNTITVENQLRSMSLSYLTYRSLTDVTVWQGTFKVTDTGAEAFAVQPEGEEKYLPEVAFTLSQQTGETREEGDINVYTVNLQLQLEPDPNGADPDAFLPVQMQLNGRFSSRTPQTSSTKADLTLTVSGEERPQTATVHFVGETRRQWAVEELPAEMTDLLSLSGAGLEDLLATLLTEGGETLGFFVSNTHSEAAAQPADETRPEPEAEQPAEAAQPEPEAQQPTGE
ncbi:MAG: hypothetical protein IKK08_00245 [Clostridia bacterium]|nr:hypothetical protein [Clostridia bacterium]